MPLRFTMADLGQRCLRRVDLEKDLSIAKDELFSLMSEKFGELYLGVGGTGMRYFEYTTTLVTTGVNYLAEPVDHLSTEDTIERVVDPVSGKLRRLKQLMPQERAFWAGRTGYARRYELVDDRIYLYPTPPAGDQYVLRYIPQPPDLKTYADADIVDVVNSHGLAFMTWGVGIGLLAKSKSDVTLCIERSEKALEKLIDWASMRSFNDPMRIVVDDDEDDFYREGDWRYDR